MNVSGKNVVVTGTIAHESRRTAEAKLQDAGANVQKAVSGTTDLLLIGGAVGQKKLGDAERLGVTVLTWEQAMGNGSSPPMTAAQRRSVPEYDRFCPRLIAPQLAKKAESVPARGANWLFEIKWDGYRCVATIEGGKVAMQSRSGKSDYAADYPEIAAQLASFPDCILDGEIAVLDDAGNSSIESMGTGTHRFIVFDVLESEVRLGDGPEDLRGWMLDSRRQVLEELLGGSSIGSASLVAMSPGWEDGEKLLAFAGEQKIEGIVAKRLDSRYVEGSRTDAWLKIKLRTEQEFIVVGTTPGEGERQGKIGAMLLAVWEDGSLVYVGKCGTGRNERGWDELEEQLVPSDGTMPEVLGVEGRMSRTELDSVTWVEPTTVVQIAFQRWTKDGALWHPSWIAFRDDKDAREVVRET
jgi:bifunctional non-homologous end joining protein LigD